MSSAMIGALGAAFSVALMLGLRGEEAQRRTGSTWTVRSLMRRQASVSRKSREAGQMVFSPEFGWRVLGLVPWWCWALMVSPLVGVAVVAELLHARAARREAAVSSEAVGAQPEGRAVRVVSGS